ncbi:GGDEF domain-containing protein [Vibrio maerlii]|uniref:GGDEF domain-containing protein n=1 Tax=Vibrio maerlii TaxID=2231648 RepID=UPI000E3E72C3|nr:GGDEF domain-containing protein [Vibrio maerlii]
MKIVNLIVKGKHIVMLSIAVLITFNHKESVLSFLAQFSTATKTPSVSVIAIELFILWLFFYLMIILFSRYYLSNRDLLAQDALTGLNNRRFLDTADRRVNKNRKSNVNQCVSVMVLDLDDFKVINDTLGHPVGDKTLIRIGEILHANVRQYDECYRVGGDEFIVILWGENHHSIVTLAARLQEKIKTDQALKELCGKAMSTSAGLAKIDIDQNVTDAIIKADGFLYEAKRRGKGVLYSH